MNDVLDTNTMQERRMFLRKSFAGGALISALALPAFKSAAAIVPLPPSPIAGSFFNVLDYGAAADGTTDDTPAIQAAISNATTYGGGIVLFPAGTYYVAGTITISGIGIHLQGVGATTSVLLAPSAGNIDTIVFSGVDSGAIRDLKISSRSPRGSGRSIFLEQTANMSIERVNMDQQFIGIQIDGGYCHRVHQCFIAISASGTGIFIGSTYPQNDTYLDNIFVTGGSSSYHIQKSGAVWMNACDSILSTCGLIIDPPEGLGVTFCFFSNCAWDSTTSHCVYISAAGSGYVNGLTFVNCWSASASSGDCVVVAGNVNGCEFVGHRFLNNPAGNGLWVSGAKYVHADACVATGITHGSGYCFTGNATNFAVRNCHAGPYGGPGATPPMPGNAWGVTVTAGCSNYIIANNMFHGNTVGAISDAGAAPKIVAQNLT
jgi:hypothetical protein